jgi:nucleotide-binding universal stress UspA family protein
MVCRSSRAFYTRVVAEPPDDNLAETGFSTVACGVDRSPQALEAARQALMVGEEEATYWGVAAWDSALAFQAGIHMAEVRKVLKEEAQAALLRLTEELPDVQPLLVEGKEVAALLAAASNLGADLVCVGASGMSRLAGIAFGSVATAMVHHAPCSVLIARDSRDFPGVILHANDGSPESLEAARYGARVAARHDSKLVTLSVGEEGSDAGEEMAEIAALTGVEPVLMTEAGSPPRRIMEIAHKVHASLIVMGSRGRTGLAALGSVSERVTHRAECSVLVVRRPSHPMFEESAD